MGDFFFNMSKCVHDCEQTKMEQQFLHIYSLEAWQPNDGDKASCERASIA